MQADGYEIYTLQQRGEDFHLVTQHLRYFVGCWAVVAILATGIPYAQPLVVALALYTSIPLFVFLRWGGWPFYPRKVFRLFVKGSKDIPELADVPLEGRPTDEIGLVVFGTHPDTACSLTLRTT